MQWIGTVFKHTLLVKQQQHTDPKLLRETSSWRDQQGANMPAHVAERTHTCRGAVEGGGRVHLLEVAKLWSSVVVGVVSDVYLSRRTWESKSPCDPAGPRPPTRCTSHTAHPLHLPHRPAAPDGTAEQEGAFTGYLLGVQSAIPEVSLSRAAAVWGCGEGR